MPPRALEGRVLKAQSGQYLVELPDGLVTAVLRGRVKKDRLQDGLVALGDRVRVERLEGPTGRGGAIGAVIREILPRASVLARRAPGPKGVWSQDVIVANVEILAGVAAGDVLLTGAARAVTPGTPVTVTGAASAPVR